MLAFPGVRGVNGSVRRVRVLVSRRVTAVQKLRLRLRPVPQDGAAPAQSLSKALGLAGGADVLVRGC